MAKETKQYQKHKYLGVRPAKSGKKGFYEIYFPEYRGSKKKVYQTVEARNEKDAYDKRVLFIQERRAGQLGASDETNLLDSKFAICWEQLSNSIAADLDMKYPKHNRIPHTELTIRKTKSKYRNVFNRLFTEFRAKYFPLVESPSQVTLPFFERYKNYYCNEINRATGWRAELTMVKAIMRRLYRLGYVTQNMVRALEEIKKPPARKKDYPDIPKNKFNDWMAFMKRDRPDLYRVVHFLRRTGRRVEETLLIEKKDVRWSGFKITKIDIVAETTKQKLQLPLDALDDDLSSLVSQAYRDSRQRKAPNLFLSEQGKKIIQKTLCRYLKKTSNQIIGVALTNHYFRHRFFTECGKRNLNIIAVMAISGLRDFKVLFRYYSHADKEGQLKVLEMSRGL